MLRLPRRFLLACLVPLGIPLAVHADDGDVLKLRASASLLRDDNLFRVSGQGSEKPMLDTITTTILGVDLNKQVSLQRFIAHVSWVDTHYAKNSNLNAGVLNYDGRWLWAAGSHLKGELTADRNSAQNSFADFQNLRQRNLRTTENQRLGLDYAFHPSWHATGGVHHQTVSNEELLPAQSDTETSGANLGIRYTPASDNFLGFQTRYSNGRYTKRPFDPSPTVLFDDEFTDSGQEFSLHWQPTGHSIINGRLEYIERRHKHFSERDVSGWTGQLGYQYQYSAKTTLSAAYVRLISPFQESTSSYYVSDDLNFASHWAATDKIGVAARLGYSHRRYRGEIVPLTGPQREDDVGRVGIDLSYKPARWLELRAGLAAEKRNSNYNDQDFIDRQAMLTAAAQF